LCIETNILTWPYSLIINDVKGDLYDRTTGFRKTIGKVFVFDPRGKGNPFDPLEGRLTDSDLQSAATTLLYRGNEGENAIFTDSAITMLTQIFHAARLEGERLLPFTQKMIYQGLRSTATDLQTISLKHNVYPNLATRFLDEEYSEESIKDIVKDKCLRSCWTTLTRRINRVLTQESVRCFNGSAFSGKDIITSKTPITVYLRWPERDILALSPLVHLVGNSLMDEMIDTFDDRKGVGCYPVGVFLDEIATTGFPKLPQYSGTAASRNISLMPVFQSTSQMDSAFGKADAHKIRANMNTQIFYRPAKADQETAEFIAKALGDRSGYAQSRTAYARGESIGESEQRIPVMTPDEIKRIGDEEIFVFPPGKTRAFLTRRLDHRRFPLLRQRIGMKPPEVPDLAPIPRSEADEEKYTIDAVSSWRSDPTLLRHRNFAPAFLEAENPPPPDFGGWN
jgi:type IV secretion system protein VirD4